MTWKRNTGYYGAAADKKLKTFTQFKKLVSDKLDEETLRARYDYYVEDWRRHHGGSDTKDN